MARKPVSRSRASARDARTYANARTELHLPQSHRTITARKLRNTPSERAQRAPRREVPEIRLSGAWLERIGFVKGRRYLISVDREIETIYLSADVAEPVRRRLGRKTVG
jgi:hypothetical protein